MSARVAVVNDDPAFLELMEAILHIKDYDSLLIQEGAGAVEALVAYVPDLIILDMIFGYEAVGWEVLTGIRAHPVLATTPVILCTFLEMAARDRVDALRAENTWYLEKPFHLEDMDALIRTLLAS